MYTLRLPGESNEQFAARAKRAAWIAKILVNACFANRCMLEYIANPELPCTEADLRISPTVRVEYEQAIAIGELSVSKPYDATIKDLAAVGPADFVLWFDGSTTQAVTLLNVDLSTVTTAADVVFGIGGPLVEILHLDAQAGPSAPSIWMCWRIMCCCTVSTECRCTAACCCFGRRPSTPI